MSDEPFILSTGRHRTPSDGRCAMEWVAHLAGEGHSDSPSSVSPVLAGFARSWNDALDDDTRQRLRPYLARTIGTAGDGLDDDRGWHCADWLARTCAPTFLDDAGLRDPARRLRSMAPLRALSSASPSLAALGIARRRAADWRRSACDARLRESDVTPRQAALDSVRRTTCTVPGVGGWDAARAAVRGAPRCLVRDTIVDLAWHMSWDAVSAAAWRDETDSRERIRQLAVAMQATVFELLDRLLPRVAVAIPAAPPRPRTTKALDTTIDWGELTLRPGEPRDDADRALL